MNVPEVFGLFALGATFAFSVILFLSVWLMADGDRQ